MKPNTRTILTLPTVLSFLLTSSLAQAATYYVATTGNDANPGTPAQPFRTIARGITAAAANGDTIQVAAGTYSEHVTWIDKNLTLQGAGSGLSIINGGGSGKCLDLSGVRNPSLIQGFTIQNGSGGGIYVVQSMLSVAHCTFTGNSGGGMSLLQCNVQVNNCIFTNNDNGIYSDAQAVSWANDCTFTANISSGIRNFSGWCSANNCTFTNNSGDGMANFNFASPSVTGCTFSNNGRGIANNGGNQATVTQCTFTGNSSGGMRNFGSSPMVISCTFSSNGAQNGGGMDNENGSNPAVRNCTFTGNSAADGGGMYNDNSSPTVSNCLFTGNIACNGGGMFNYQSNPSLINCTFSGNQHNFAACGIGSGAGMWNGASVPTLSNCILWGDWGPEIFNGGLSATVTYSDIQGGYPGTGNINADPLFVNPAGANYHLQAGSPCINAGSAAVPNLPATDFDGFPRIMGSNPDMGAFETVPAVYTWYVDKAIGSDANPGTLASPFATVTRAITVAINGNSIYIRQGNYGTDRPRMTKALRFVNWGNTGLSRIGQP